MLFGVEFVSCVTKATDLPHFRDDVRADLLLASLGARILQLSVQDQGTGLLDNLR